MHWLRFGPRRLGLLLASALLLMGAAGCAAAPSSASKRVDPPASFPDFSLVAAQGQAFRLSELKGNVVVVYVGYTHCPDICPLMMGNLAAARRLLPESLKDDVKVVMITADPARDTPELVTQYVHHFDPTFIGVSGSTEQVLTALRQWGISPECGIRNADGGYTVSHPTTSYVLNREGLLRLQVPLGLEPAAIARDLKSVAKEGKR